ncbi:MAG: hypothetical protein FWG87_12845 [Defluviitaleaceae bacterium]|nr:hypothetical protein [Defluviitaleaceae bacterium]
MPSLVESDFFWLLLKIYGTRIFADLQQDFDVFNSLENIKVNQKKTNIRMNKQKNPLHEKM